MFGKHPGLIQPKKSASIPLEKLIENSKAVRQAYIDQGGDDVERCKLISEFECAFAFIEENLSSKNKSPTKSELHELAYSIYITCMGRIESEYQLLLSPNRSRLYNILSTGIQSKEFPCDVFDKIDYMTLYQKHFFDSNIAMKFKNALIKKDSKLDVKKINENIEIAIGHIFYPINKKLPRLLQAISSEKALDLCLQDFYPAYLAQTKHDNLDKKFLALLTQTICRANPANEEENHKPNFLSPTQRLKMAMAMFNIETTKTLLFPSGALNDLSEAAFFHNYAFIPNALRVECLCVLQSYLATDANKRLLEHELSKDPNFLINGLPYLYTELHKMNIRLEQMITHMHTPVKTASINTKIGLTVLGAVLGGIPGMGIGYTISCGLNVTNGAQVIKDACKPHTGYILKMVAGDGAEMLAQFATEIYVNETTKFAMGTICGGICSAIGILTGLTVSIAITEVTPSVIDQLINCYHTILRHPPFKPILDQNKFVDIDPRILRCLQKLPPSVLAASHKNKLQALAGDHTAVTNFFYPKVAKDSAVAPSQIMIAQCK